MRTISTAQAAALQSAAGAARWYRVRIADAGGTLRDLSSLFDHDWQIGASWGETVDGRGIAADITLTRDRYADSLSPLMSATRAATIGGGTLLALRRAVRIEAAVVASESAPGAGDWIEVFRGYIDSIDPSGRGVKVACRDQIAVLQDTIIETEGEYGSSGGTAVETVMQSILDDALGAGVVTLYTPTSPGWMLLPFLTELQSVHDQLLLLSDQIGWQLRYRWDAGTSAYRLTFYTPDRSKSTVDQTFTPDQFFDITQLSVSIEDIRNVCIVEWSDPGSLDSSGQPERDSVTVTDAASIASYGRRTMIISEAATSNISTSTEATTLATNCVSDLSEPTATMAVEVLFFPFVELDDRYTFTADNTRFDTDLTLTVVGYQHTLDGRGARTTLTLRGSAPSRGTQAYTEMGGTRGIGPLLTQTGPLPGVSPEVIEGILGVRTRFPQANPKISRWEVHAGASGFAPSLTDLSTVLGSGRTALPVPIDLDRLPVDTDRDFVFYPLDRYGNRGAAQRVTNKRAKRGGTHMFDPPARIGGGFLGGFFGSQTRGSSYPPDRWSMSAGTWGTNADLDDGTTYSAPTTGEKALLLTTSSAVSLVSDALPVTPTRTYRAQAAFKASSTAPTVQIGAEWLDADQASLSVTQYLWNAVPSGTGKWINVAATLAPPSGARWVRFSIGKTSTSPTSVNVAIDRLLIEEEVIGPPDLTTCARVFDDFAADDTAGALPWVLHGLGADPITNPPTTSHGTSTGWTVYGTTLIETAALSGYGGLLLLGDPAAPTLYGAPPEGWELRARVRLQGGTYTNVASWVGLTEKADEWPDPSGSYSCSFLGFAVRAAGSAANWYGIVRNGATESTVDLGVAGGATWTTLSVRKTASGYQFGADGADVGSPVATTNQPAGALCPGVGVLTGTAAARKVEIDFYAMTWRIER